MANKQVKSKQPSLHIAFAFSIVLVSVAASFLAYSYAVAPNSDVDNASSQNRLIGTHSDSSAIPAAPAKTVHDYTIPAVTNGVAPLLTHIPTKEPVVFLGIDDGANKQPFELQMMKENHVFASLFLADRFIKDDPTFFTSFINAGSLVEDHTVNHVLLSQHSYAEQKKEICDEADKQATEFGRRPVLLRPPGGDYNSDTLRAAAACGMKAVVNWIAKANGGSMQYQEGHALRPGDIVLMHFRPEFKDDMNAFLKAEHAAGLHTELLEDWLGVLLAELLVVACWLLALLPLGSGVICCPTITSRFNEVPGGSQVMSVAVAVWPSTGPSTLTSLGSTTVLLMTLYTYTLPL